MAEKVIVTEIEHFRHFEHFQRERAMVYKTLKRLIPFLLADKEKLKAGKPIDAP